MVGRMVLVDKYIKGLIYTAKLAKAKPLIDPFDPEKLGPVSYDLTTEFDQIPWDGNMARLVSVETITLPRNITAIVGLRSRAVIKEEVFASFSFLVDPGFSGKLTFLVYSPANYAFNWEDLFQIIFIKIKEPEVAYNERKTSKGMGRSGF